MHCSCCCLLSSLYGRIRNLPFAHTLQPQVWIILLASALAQIVSCALTCPVEAVRIRVMTCDRRPEFLSFIGKTQEIYEQEGLLYFWSGIGALLFRELPFAIAKVCSSRCLKPLPPCASGSSPAHLLAVCPTLAGMALRLLLYTQRTQDNIELGSLAD